MCVIILESSGQMLKDWHTKGDLKVTQAGQQAVFMYLSKFAYISGTFGDKFLQFPPTLAPDLKGFRNDSQQKTNFFRFT